MIPESPPDTTGRPRGATPLEFVVRKGTEVRVVRVEATQAFLGLRPWRVTGVEVQRSVVEERNGIVHVIKVGEQLIRLSPAEHQALGFVDGRTSVGELAFAWFLQFGSIDVQGIVGLLQAARRLGLVEWHPGGPLALQAGAEEPGLRGAVARGLNRWLRWEIRWVAAGAWLKRSAEWIRPLIRPGLDPVWVTSGVLGVVAWVALRPPDLQMPLLSWLLLTPLLTGVLLVIHELGHAFAVFASDREVRAVGISAQWLVPLPYVDCTDMFLSTRSAHARVALAGPAANLVAAAAAVALALALAPLPAWGDVFWLAADISLVLAAINLWPFMVPGDGYNALCDVLGMPRLRQKAREQLMTRLRGVEAPALLPGEAWRCALYLSGVSLSVVFSLCLVAWTLAR